MMMADEAGSRDLDQEWNELLQELRVILPGVQVLFAFLLTIPFSSRFNEISGMDRGLYFVAFLSTAIASVLLIAPSVYHRLLWRQHDKEYVLVTTNRFVLSATVFLALSVAAVVFLVTDLLYRSAMGAGVAAALTGVMTWFWYGLPLSRRRQR